MQAGTCLSAHIQVHVGANTHPHSCQFACQIAPCTLQFNRTNIQTALACAASLTDIDKAMEVQQSKEKMDLSDQKEQQRTSEAEAAGGGSSGAPGSTRQ